MEQVLQAARGTRGFHFPSLERIPGSNFSTTTTTPTALGLYNFDGGAVTKHRAGRNRSSTAATLPFHEILNILCAKDLVLHQYCQRSFVYLSNVEKKLILHIMNQRLLFIAVGVMAV